MINSDGIYVNFPDYQVDTETELGKQPLGHGMVIAVDEKTGRTRGSEYGRYSGDGRIKGKAHRVRVPDFNMAKAGSPTQDELDAYAKALNDAYGHSGGRTEITYVKDADYNKLVDMMKSAESGNEKTGYYQIKPYSLINHNCGTYASDMLQAATPVFSQIKYAITSPGFGWNHVNNAGTPSMAAPKSILMPRATYDDPNVKNPTLIGQLAKTIFK